jgi:lysozyme
MAYPINAIVIDLSHWDSASDYNAVKNDGIYGCIYKATEGTSYTDPTYVGQQHAAKAAGLRWGTYHFANSSDVNKQIDNFMRFASPDPDELFSLDWEDNGGDTMSLNDVKTWITQVEKQLGREGQCVLYSGNTAKEKLGDNVDTFLGARRLWLSQYGSTPSWQKSWNKFWLWQYTDGRSGPQPHSVDGVGNCDISSYDNTADQLVAEWATGSARPSPPLPPPGTQPVTVLFAAPAGVTVKVRQFTPGVFERRNSRPDRAIEGGIRKKRSRVRNKR